MLSLFAKLAMLGLSSVGTFDRTPYPVFNDPSATLIPAQACYTTQDPSTPIICYDPSICPSPALPEFDFCTQPNFQG